MEEFIRLVERSKEGDTAAFSELYAMYANELYRFALYMTGVPEDAEDAVQEAVISAWQNIHNLNDNSLFKAWLFKILSNRCKTDLMKKNKLSGTLPVDEYEFLVENQSADESFVNGTELKSALSQLTPPDGQIIVLSVIGGFKSYEIADIYGMTPSTVRSRQKRALEKLRNILL